MGMVIKRGEAFFWVSVYVSLSVFAIILGYKIFSARRDHLKRSSNPSSVVTSHTATPPVVQIGGRVMGETMPSEAVSIFEGHTMLGELRFKGRDTPENAVESLFWAGVDNEQDQWPHCFYLSEHGKQSLADYWRSLPAAEQQKLGTPEAVIGMLFSYEMLKKTDAVRIDAAVLNDEGTVYVPIESVRGTTGMNRKSARFQMRRTDDGWRFVVSDHVIDSLSTAFTAVANEVNEKSDSSLHNGDRYR